MIENVTPTQAWDALRTDPQARMVDVRTDAEWTYVGLPDLTGASGPEPLLIPWQLFPSMQVNGAFTQQLQQAGLTPQHKLFFLCRSGVRSVAAATAAQAAGYPHAYNIVDGFEGPGDEDGHRGTAAGWKVDGLPWRQR
ncbi:MAG: rhodanese-like domain-containing protein [Gemmatimonadaceae bacterium]|nr:rhodanese-like domain-containing protein [Acetobacteraceae bacterium]